MQLYCMFCGGKLIKNEEGMFCFNCNTKFMGIISESEDEGVIERSICMDCITIKHEIEVKAEVEAQASIPDTLLKVEV